MKKLILFSFVFNLAACAVTSSSLNISIGDYQSSVDVYVSKNTTKENKSISIIVLYSKVNGRVNPRIVDLAVTLSEVGYAVYVPEMPYSNYQETLTTSFKFIDRIVQVAAKNNNNIIIIGHSMGAAVTLLYCAAYKCPPEIAAVVMQAAGHMLQLSNRLQEATALDVQRARKLVKQGKSHELQTFTDFNQGNKISINTTAEIYRSYFDPAVFPNPATHLETMAVPVLWIDGDHDRAARMGYENLFDRMNQYTQFPENNYIVVDGDHVDMLDYTPEQILKWIIQFEE